MRRSENIEKLIGKLNDTTSAEMDREILKDVFKAMDKSKQKQPAPAGQNIGRLIMNSKITKLATAAVILLAVLIGINSFLGTGASVAWASLAERVGSIQTCFYKEHSTINSGPQGEKVRRQEGEVYLSSEYGFRSDTYVDGNASMMQYMIPAEKVIISVMHAHKKYMRASLTDEMLEKMRLQGNDPRDIVRRFMLWKYTHLGESVINGVKVEGIETTDPRVGGGQFEKYLARCWVDVETQLPVLLEMEMEMSTGPDMLPMKISMVMDSFEWDIDISPEIFEPEIPSDYQLMGETQMPGQDEGSAVNGLRVFAEITGGKYPQTLTVMSAIRECTEAVKKRSEKEWQSKVNIDPSFKPTQDEIDGVRSKAMVEVMAVQGACMFYAELVKADKDAAYYGDKVTADDVDAVLMRWKISESEYRVIFGDLTAENIGAEQLVELEATIAK